MCLLCMVCTVHLCVAAPHAPQNSCRAARGESPPTSHHVCGQDPPLFVCPFAEHGPVVSCGLGTIKKKTLSSSRLVLPPWRTSPETLDFIQDPHGKNNGWLSHGARVTRYFTSECLLPGDRQLPEELVVRLQQPAQHAAIRHARRVRAGFCLVFWQQEKGIDGTVLKVVKDGVYESAEVTRRMVDNEARASVQLEKAGVQGTVRLKRYTHNLNHGDGSSSGIFMADAGR